jgi:glycosyltransferase involved in cell wall biosynthesis
MRILLLVDNYLPSPRSVARMIHELGVEFIRLGHKVILVTPSDEISQPLRISADGGIQVVRVRAGTLKNIHRIIRAWRETRLSATLWGRARGFFERNPCDLIIWYSPSIFFGSLVNRLKLLWHCPAYLILRDIFPKWAVDAGVLRKGVVYRYFRRKELLQYSAADIIGVEAPGNLRYFHDELPGTNYRLEVLLNWANPEVRPVSTGRYREQLGLAGKVVFFYGGTIGVAQDMDDILRLAAGLRGEERIFLLLVGSGSEVGRVANEIRKQGLPNIAILPSVSQQEYPQLASEFDVGIVTLERRLTTHCCPGKALSYMACGLPILASINPGNDLAALLKEADAGIACENGDDDSLRAAAILLAGNPGLRERLGKNARKMLEAAFSVRTAAAQILNHLQTSDISVAHNVKPVNR